jgi:CO dehydrogenase/acetyl-CoA synthase beta subunit
VLLTILRGKVKRSQEEEAERVEEAEEEEEEEEEEAGRDLLRMKTEVSAIFLKSMTSFISGQSVLTLLKKKSRVWR